MTLTPVVRHASKKDQDALAALLHFGGRSHRHLGWQPAINYLGQEAFWVVSRPDGLLEAALAAPIEPPGVAWLRILTCMEKTRCTADWKILWQQAQSYFQRHKPVEVAALVLNRWLRALLLESGFQLVDEVVNLELHLTASPALDAPPQPDLLIRTMQPEDLAAVAALDAAAFPPLWQNPLHDLRAAYRQSVYATVVEQDDRLVGYQLSSHAVRGMHISRLAVAPEAQHRGVGRFLSQDLLAYGYRRGVRDFSVNTQRSNQVSLNLYRRLGFETNDDVFPVLVYRVA